MAKSVTEFWRVYRHEVATSFARSRSLCLHFIHASSGAPHSQARVPIMHVCRSYRDAGHKVVVWIVGDMLVLLVNFDFEDIKDVIYVIDWKSGHIAMVSTGSKFSAYDET
jgi:hypothetical protein